MRFTRFDQQVNKQRAVAHYVNMARVARLENAVMLALDYIDGEDDANARTVRRALETALQD